MQIITQSDRLIFISENPTVREEDKIQALIWANIKTIAFIYPSKNNWKILRDFFTVTFGFVVGSEINGALAKSITIDITLKNGQRVSKEFNVYSTRDGQKLEQEFSTHLNIAGT